MKTFFKKAVASVLLFSMLAPSSTAFASNENADEITFSDLEKEGFKADEKIKVIVETDDKSALEREPDFRSRRFRSAIRSSQDDVEDSREKIENKMKKENVDLDTQEEFSAVITGFSAEIKAKDIDKLSEKRGVKKVLVQMQASRPDAKSIQESPSSKNMIKTNVMWNDYNLTGQGMLVSIIDTGVDPNHKDMKLDPDVDKKYKDKEAVNSIINQYSLKGKWFNDKVPYGYNYADESLEIRDSEIGGFHGMHVAGIVGANGDVESGGIKGVAPNVQLLGMKVFSNDALVSTVYEEVWLKAIDDSVKLGADVLNMSLGMASGYSVDGQTASELAFQRARKAGVVCAVAMGNDRVTNWGGEGKTNLAINPDMGTTGHPAVTGSSFSVSSIENEEIRRREIIVEGKDLNIQVSPAEGENENTSTGPVEYINVGLGNEESDYEGKDLRGKIALIQRGGKSFQEKAALAISKGASGVVIYNSQDGNELSSMTGIENKEIPTVFITYDEGLKLIQLQKENPTQKISISPIKIVKNKNGGQMSTFSSWGITPDLRLKPDIAGVGGNIYSTINDDKYTVMSGTSMATPQVAAASALAMQRLYKDGILKRSEDGKADPNQEFLTVLFMMNTAEIIKDSEVANASYYTPKQQGAGLVNLEKLAKSNISLTATGAADEIEDGKLEVGEVGDSFEANFNFKNYSDKEVVFDAKYISLKDEVGEDGRYTEHSSLIEEKSLGSVKVKADGESNFKATISTKNVPKNQFAQGYVIFESKDHPSLSVPFTGFKGDWSEPKIIDNMPDFSSDVNYLPIVADNGAIDKSGFARRRENGGWDYWNAWNVDGVPTVFVNSNKQDNFYSEVIPVISVMRNAIDIRYDILNQDGSLLKHLFIDPRIAKVNGLYKDEYNKYNFEYLAPGAGWDFTDLKSNKVADGNYQYQITAKIDYKDAKEQKYNYKIILDSVAPEVRGTYNSKDRTVTVTAKDDNSGLIEVGFENLKTGEWYNHVLRYDEDTNDELVKDYTYTFEVPESFDLSNLYVYAWDNARNVVGNIKVDTGVDSKLEIKPLEIKVNDPVPTIDQVKDHLENLDPKAEVKIVENIPDTQSPGDFEIKIGVTIDGNENYYFVPVKIIGEDVNKEEESDQPIENTEEVDENVYDLPITKILNPDYYAAFGKNNNQIDFAGNVSKVKELEELSLSIQKDGKQVEGTEVQSLDFEKVSDSLWEFNEKVDLSKLDKSAVYELSLTAKGRNIEGKEIQDTVIRRIRKDNIAPELEYEVIQEDKTLPIAKIRVKGHEDMTYFEILINDSMFARVDKTWDAFELEEGIDAEFEADLPLDLGENIFTLRSTDDAMNETVQEIKIIREEPASTQETDYSNLLTSLLKAQEIILLSENYEITEEELQEIKALINQAREVIAAKEGQEKADEINSNLKEILATIDVKENPKLDFTRIKGSLEDAKDLLDKRQDLSVDEKKNLEDLVKRAENLMRADQVSQEDLDKLQEEILKEIGRLEALDKNDNTDNKKEEELENKNKELEAKLQALQDQITKLQKELDKAQSENPTNKDQQEELKKQNQDLQKQIAKLKEDLDKQIKELQKTQKENQASQKEKEQVEKYLKALKDKEKQLEEANQKLQDQLNKKDQDNKKDKEELINTNKDLQAKTKELQDKIAKLEKELAETKKQNPTDKTKAELEKQNQDLQKQIAKLKEDLDKQIKELQKAQ
ncbi:MAG: S8 family serine peptidase, partial [Finegoldia sp.]|nr:S8 family serine peptidase [Finegoldia sp.]